jgi:hypothetical protein
MNFDGRSSQAGWPSIDHKTQQKTKCMSNKSRSVILSENEGPCGTPTTSQRAYKIEDQPIEIIVYTFRFTKNKSCQGELIGSPQQTGLFHIPIEIKECHSSQPKLKS